MSTTIQIDEQPTTQIPDIRKLPVILQVTKAGYWFSAAENKSVRIDCEIVQPDKINYKGKEYVIAGGRTSLYLMLEGAKFGETINFANEKMHMGLTSIDIPESKDDTEACQKLAQIFNPYPPLAFRAAISSQDQITKIYSVEKGEMVPAQDSNGNEIRVKGWMLVNVNDILERVDPLQPA